MTFIVATNVVASRPPERRPTGMPHPRAKSFLRQTLFSPLLHTQILPPPPYPLDHLLPYILWTSTCWKPPFVFFSQISHIYIALKSGAYFSPSKSENLDPLASISLHFRRWSPSPFSNYLHFLWHIFFWGGGLPSKAMPHGIFFENLSKPSPTWAHHIFMRSPLMHMHSLHSYPLTKG